MFWPIGFLENEPVVSDKNMVPLNTFKQAEKRQILWILDQSLNVFKYKTSFSIILLFLNQVLILDGYCRIGAIMWKNLYSTLTRIW
jgi:hypothetical protein